jgi:hypothetical protein
VKLEPTIFVGESSDALARVYATLPRDGLADGPRLEGELIGPYCRYSKTLPARIHFADRGPGSSLLAEAVVPDPCFWSPDLPFLYTAELRVVAGEAGAGHESRQRHVRPIGIRRLGVQGKSLYLDAKRLVLRGVRIDAAAIDDLIAAKQAASALFVTDPNDSFLQEASEKGVLLVVELHTSQLTTELSRLSRWPAVSVVVLPGDVPAGKDLRLVARNTLLAQESNAAHESTELAPWAHLLWWRIESRTQFADLPARNLPIIAYRPISKNATIELGRRACDRLQADLAPLGDFAGYFT